MIAIFLLSQCLTGQDLDNLENFILRKAEPTYCTFGNSDITIFTLFTKLYLLASILLAVILILPFILLTMCVEYPGDWYGCLNQFITPSPLLCTVTTIPIKKSTGRGLVCSIGQTAKYSFKTLFWHRGANMSCILACLRKHQYVVRCRVVACRNVASPALVTTVQSAVIISISDQ